MGKINFLWWIDPIKTENYLNEQSELGYNLNNISTSGSFTFNNSNIRKEYKITYNEFLNNLPTSLIESGWEIAEKRGKFSILAKDKGKTSKYSISRNAIIDRLYLFRKVFANIYIVYLLFNLIPLLIMMPLIFGAENVIYSTGWWIGPSVMVILHSLAIYFLICISKGIKKLNLESHSPIKNVDNTHNYKEKIIRKFKLAWFYSPDKTEKYLENMELKGYNLVKVSKIGSIFYFKIGEKRKMKYCVDYVYKINPEYFQMHKSDNWKLCFTTSDMIGYIVIWSKEYTNNEEVLNIFTDKESMLKRAKRSLLVYSPLLFCLILYFFVLLSMSRSHLNNNSLLKILYILIIIEYGIFYSRVVSYYFRVKKLIK